MTALTTPPRRRLAIAVAVWALLPATFAIRSGSPAAAAFLGGLAILPVLVVSLVRSGRIAALLLALLASPIAVQFIHANLLARGAAALAVADSPLGFLTGRIAEILAFVPLFAFAVAVWRRSR